MPHSEACANCLSSGEVPTDFGPVDCPDCGGAGFLPARGGVFNWLGRPLAGASAAGRSPDAQDVQWLLSELRGARAALTEIIALAHDVSDPDAISMRIRFAANRALGLYTVTRHD
jgi:hypothetical protein